MKKVVKNICVFLVLTIMLFYFSIIGIGTASKMAIGEEFSKALPGAVIEVNNELLKIIGLKPKADIILDFKNGTIGFNNTCRNW